MKQCPKPRPKPRPKPKKTQGEYVKHYHLVDTSNRRVPVWHNHEDGHKRHMHSGERWFGYGRTPKVRALYPGTGLG